VGVGAKGAHPTTTRKEGKICNVDPLWPAHQPGRIGRMRDVDALLKETDDALRRIDGLKRAKQGRAIGARGASSQLLNVALAAGLVGLSMLRYHENKANRRAIDELEREVAVVSGRSEALASAVEEAVQRGHDKAGTSWGRLWGRSVSGCDGLREALVTFRSGR
jgi:hypothetical protein